MDFITLAYEAATGDEVWAARYDAPGGGQDRAEGVVLSPDGSTVFVTGESKGRGTFDYATIAYDTSDGEVVWKKRFDAGRSDFPTSMGVSPDGATVFVTGTSRKPGQKFDYLTVAYDASGGGVIWHTRYDGPRDGSSSPIGLVLSPDGSTIFVTGTSEGTITTLAYDSSEGTRLWIKRSNGGPDDPDVARGVTVSPSGDWVFVTGISRGLGTSDDYATIAYAAANGDILWTKRFDGRLSGDDRPTSIAVSPDGSSVYVTGSSTGPTAFPDYLTVSYDASDGSRSWIDRRGRPHQEDVTIPAVAVAVSPDGSSVFVTGTTATLATATDYDTVAYDAITGAELWNSRYVGPSIWDDAIAMSVSPLGSTVFVTGISKGVDDSNDIATVAYAT